MNKEKVSSSYYKSLKKSAIIKVIRFFRNIVGNIQEELEVAVDKGSLEKVRELLAIGADPNLRFGFQQTTFLHRARSVEIIRELVAHGADVNAQDVYHCTPLYYSVTKESAAIVHELLSCGAEVNAPDENGDTALTLALNDYPKLEVIQELLEHGARVNPHDVDRYVLCYFTRSCSAIKTMQLPVARLLLKYTLLQHFDENFGKVVDLEPYSKCKNYIELVSFRDDCACEIFEMKTHMINKNFSIYNYLVRKPANVKPYSNDTPIEQEISLKYPIYHDIILSNLKPCFERTDLMDKFTSLQVSFSSSSKEIILGFDCLRAIAEYLSNEDLANFISSFENNFTDQGYLKNSFNKKKEIESYSIKCSIF